MAIAIIGDVVTDVVLPQDGNKFKMRLGGCSHSARTAWALGIHYDLLYYSPSYLVGSVNDYHLKHGANCCSQLGVVDGAPYVFIIGNAKETSDQQYEFILRDNIKIVNKFDSFLKTEIYDDVLIICGNYDLNSITENINAKHFHIDLSNNITSFDQIAKCKFETIFLSTSSTLFTKECNGDVNILMKKLIGRCNQIVFKENRGGSRIFDMDTKVSHSIPCIFQEIVHSVGVGDSYDIAYISFYRKYGIKEAGFISAWISSEYASTTYPDDFKRNVERILKMNVTDLIGLGGCALPWEKRRDHSIYIAAPDFDYVNTERIDDLCDSLLYHNFTPRRPVKENGQIQHADDKSIRVKTYSKDIELLHQCSILIVVYLNDDPGTMIELGYAKAMGIYCIVYDPYSKASNCMLTELPDFLSSSIDEVIRDIFQKIASMIK